ncbi:hypothetical protein [Metaclostridioides mangenotii]|uniref:hypothetical protein n=1 Tax=Metaclostridioides mangenotii TaxID=1540 RepID=UPI000489B7E5|nr:hypothetical protein [Clostridioides mangenotii]
MKTITLKQLVIQDLKDIKRLNIDFSKTTNINGENALGKTRKRLIRLRGILKGNFMINYSN